MLGAEPPLTSVKPDFRHPIDYIFTSKGLTAKAVLNVIVGSMPDDVAAAREEPWPSDHLALLAEVELGQSPTVATTGRVVGPRNAQ